MRRSPTDGGTSRRMQGDFMSTKTMPGKIEKSETEWRGELTPMQYAVLREKATERPFSGEYEHEQRTGTYVCAGCGQTCSNPMPSLIPAVAGRASPRLRSK